MSHEEAAAATGPEADTTRQALTAQRSIPPRPSSSVLTASSTPAPEQRVTCQPGQSADRGARHAAHARAAAQPQLPPRPPKRAWPGGSRGAGDPGVGAATLFRGGWSLPPGRRGGGVSRAPRERRRGHACGVPASPGFRGSLLVCSPDTGSPLAALFRQHGFLSNVLTRALQRTHIFLPAPGSQFLNVHPAWPGHQALSWYL